MAGDAEAGLVARAVRDRVAEDHDRRGVEREGEEEEQDRALHR